MIHILSPLVTGALLFLTVPVFPQETGNILFQQKLEELSGSDIGETDFQDLAEALRELRDHPVNLNGATAEELKKIPFITDVQVKKLLEYIDSYGELLTLHELQAVEGFDSASVSRIAPYLSVGETGNRHPLSLYNLITEGGHLLLVRYQRVLQKQQGYETGDSVLRANPTAGYLGSPDRISFRYRYSYFDRVGFGIYGDKDPGEEFFRGSQKYGMDFYSGYFALQNTGILKTLVIGDYHAEFGQGLTMGSSTSFSSLLSCGNYIRTERGITPALSSDENKFLRGVAGTLRTDHFSFSAFFSRHPRDGNIVLTGERERSVSSFGTSGYHRNPAEIADKRTIRETVCGANMSYRNRFLKTGVTAAWTEWNIPLHKAAYAYNRYSFSGSQNLVLGLDVLAVLRDHYLFGEIADSRNGGLAGMAGMAWAPGARLSFSVIYRNYGRDYWNFHCNAVGRHAGCSNEKGILLNFTVTPSRNYSMEGYLDICTSPWLRYRKNLVTRGTEFLLINSFSPEKNIRMVFRYRSASGQINGSGDATITKWVRTNSRSYRLDMEWQVMPQMNLKTRMEMVRTKTEIPGIRYGCFIAQDLFYQPLKSRFRLAFRYAFFDTYSYGERIYAYEHDFTGSFTVPAFEGKGIRCYLMFDREMFRWLRAGVRYAQTFYEDRNTIGSGINSIDGNTESEIKFQLQFRF